ILTMAPGDDFAGSAGNGRRLFRRQAAKTAIDLGAGQLDRGQRMNQFGRHALGRYGKVHQRALCLRPPQRGSRHLQRTEGVLLAARRAQRDVLVSHAWSPEGCAFIIVPDADNASMPLVSFSAAESASAPPIFHPSSSASPPFSLSAS